MPFTAQTPITVEPAKTGTVIHCVGVNIRMPRAVASGIIVAAAPTITYSFEIVDAQGNLMSRESITVPLATIQAEKNAAYAAIYATIKQDAYDRYRAAKGNPAGSVS